MSETNPACRPMLFSAPMVLAIGEGIKTKTRRVMDPQPKRILVQGVPEAMPSHFCVHGEFGAVDSRSPNLKRIHGDAPSLPCPYGNVGDHIWVREAFRMVCDAETKRYGIRYLADDVLAEYWPNYDRCLSKGKSNDIDAFVVKHANGRALPSIHMPRWASRYTLRIVTIRAERLDDITEIEAREEGIRRVDGDVGPFYGINALGGWRHITARRAFVDLWNDINASRGFSWYENPWVWVVGFRKLEPEAPK